MNGFNSGFGKCSNLILRVDECLKSNGFVKSSNSERDTDNNN